MIIFQKKMSFSLIFFLSLVVFVPNLCLAMNIYEWKEYNKPFEIDDKKALYKSAVIVKVDLPEDFLLSAEKKIKFYTKVTGSVGTWHKLVLIVNDSGPTFRVRKKMTIGSKHFKAGSNELKFIITGTDGATSVTPSGNIAIRKISFSELN